MTLLSHGDFPSIEELTAMITDPDVFAGKYLPQEEQDRYRAAQQSVIDARRYAEVHAHEHYIGAVKS